MKKTMKIIAGVTLASIAILGSFSSCKKANAQKPEVCGSLSFLNMSEEKSGLVREAVFMINGVLKEKGIVEEDEKVKPERPEKVTTRYYDNLDSLLMALKAGEIGAIQGLPQSTAFYLCSKDPTLVMPYTYHYGHMGYRKTDWDNDSFAHIAFNRLADGFSFMMLEKNAALRDQFNAVIAEMEKDGTSRKLREEQIINVLEGKEAPLFVPEIKPGRESIKVAVTGDLPPMDYVAADGTFSGYNTAFLAEIGKRLDKNITMVQVTSVGRAAALASGTVDVVFWTRSDAKGSKVFSAEMDEWLKKENMEQRMAKATDAENEAMNALTEAFVGKADGDSRKASYTKDMPDGTIVTEPYFLDLPSVVLYRK